MRLAAAYGPEQMRHVTLAVGLRGGAPTHGDDAAVEVGIDEQKKMLPL